MLLSPSFLMDIRPSRRGDAPNGKTDSNIRLTSFLSLTYAHFHRNNPPPADIVPFAQPGVNSIMVGSPPFGRAPSLPWPPSMGPGLSCPKNGTHLSFSVFIGRMVSGSGYTGAPAGAPVSQARTEPRTRNTPPRRYAPPKRPGARAAVKAAPDGAAFPPTSFISRLSFSG